MPISIPRLDDRTFADLTQELLARIPAHTPEWTNPRPGDPGRTLIELFAWLGDTLLYRANLIPERQRFAFLRLLGTQLRPATPARGLVALRFDDKTVVDSVSLVARGKLTSSASFETTSEVTVAPVSAECYVKRPLTEDEKAARNDVLQGLAEVYDLGSAPPIFYETTSVFAGGLADLGGVDLAATVDSTLWIALLAPKPESVDAVRRSLGGTADGTPTIVSIGVAPSVAPPPLDEPVTLPRTIAHRWDQSGPDADDGSPVYHPLSSVADTTSGLARLGVVRLVLTAAKDIGAPQNDVRSLNAGLGDRPPRIDDPDRSARLVTWIRLRITEPVQTLQLAWIGINAVEIEQLTTSTGKVIGTSNGTADQQMTLGSTSIDASSLVVEVEETSIGFVRWTAIDDLLFAARDAAAYTLDAEAGTLRFGDGVNGRIPDAGRRVRVAQMRAGGGAAGNLAAGALQQFAGIALSGRPPAQSIKVSQPLPTFGGDDAETVAHAEQRIPAMLRHGDRAVTANDWRQLAAETPGVSLARIEILPRFKPQQHRDGVPGVISVMVFPAKSSWHPPNPRADRRTLELVFAYLDARRTLSTELYVIGSEYVGIALTVAVQLRDGYPATQVLANVREALFAALGPLPAGAINPGGWPLGRAVRDREIEVFIAQVPGVASVAPVNLFKKGATGFEIVAPQVKPSAGGAARGGKPRRDEIAEITLSSWQLPELLAVVAIVGDDADSTVQVSGGDGADGGIAVPTAPEVC